MITGQRSKILHAVQLQQKKKKEKKKTGIWDCGEKDHRLIVAIDLDHLGEVMFAGCLHYKVSLFLHPFQTL